MTSTATDRQQELRRQLVEKARPQAEKYLNDHRYAWLRPVGRRRALVVAAVAGIVIHGAVLWTGGPPLLALGLLGANWAAYALLKWTVRGMADLPDELIDERMQQVRNRQYRAAYIALSSLTALVLLLAWIAADASRVQWQPQARHLEAMFWCVLMLSIGLPSMLLAWTEPEI